MISFFKNKSAWVEAIGDTALGTIINLPLNIIILTITFKLQLSVLDTSIVLWIVFTVVAIIRKYAVRKYFIYRQKLKK